jgi:hypothetical protein
MPTYYTLERIKELGWLSPEAASKLRQGIQDYLDGNYEHPSKHRPGKCEHGVYYYEECGACIDAHFEMVLQPVALEKTTS